MKSTFQFFLRLVKLIFYIFPGRISVFIIVTLVQETRQTGSGELDDTHPEDDDKQHIAYCHAACTIYLQVYVREKLHYEHFEKNYGGQNRCKYYQSCY